MIYIRTTAYNASKTLKRAVESILNQTYGQFEYYLVENGSTDKGATKKIIEEYARRDSRVKPFFNQKNHVWDANKEAAFLPHNIGEEDYFCLLDADDEYSLTFFEEMLAFMERNQLDIAACGSDFTRVEDGMLIGKRLFPQDLILEGQSFEHFFPAYHQFMRTIWGKLFKGKTLRNTILDSTSPEMPQVYGNDTFFTMRAFRDAKRAGILGKILHRYYMSSKSTSYIFSPDRSKCDRILRNAMLDFLKPYGPISQVNMDFINSVHANACKDSLVVIFNAKISTLEKMKWIQELLADTGVTQIFQSTCPDVTKPVSQMREWILAWIRKQTECETTAGAEFSAEIAKLLLPKHEAFSFLWKMWSERPGLIRKLGKKKWLEQHLLTDPLLEGISMNLAFTLPNTVEQIMQGNYLRAWEQFISANEIDVREEDEAHYYLLGQNLAALVEDFSGYVYFKKIWIEYLITHERTSEADAELREFETLLPNDSDFLQLRKRIDQSFSM